MAKPHLKEVIKEKPQNFRTYLEEGNPIYDPENPKYSMDKITRQTIDSRTKLMMEQARSQASRPKSAYNGGNSPKSAYNAGHSKSVISI